MQAVTVCPFDLLASYRQEAAEREGLKVPGPAAHGPPRPRP